MQGKRVRTEAASSGPALSHFDSRNEGGVTLILLHGFGGSRETWKNVIPLLPEDIRIIAPDLPGHGQSTAIPDRGYARSAAAEVLALMADRQIDAAHLCGFSLGGAVASIIAMSDPERVRSLTLVAPGGYGPEIAGDALKALASACDAAAIRHAFTLMTARDAAIPQDEIEVAVREKTVPGAVERLERIVTMIVRDGIQGELPAAALAALSLPVKVLWGTRDPVLPHLQSKNLPGSFQLASLPDKGHMLPFEAPQAIADMLIGQVFQNGTDAAK